MSKLDEQDFDERRLERRKRRKRNQFIAYIVFIIIIVLLVGAIGTSIHFIHGAIVSRRRAIDAAEKLTKGVEEQPENIVIETPENSTDVEEYTQEEAMTDIVEKVIGDMTIEDKVAGLFIINPEQITGVETAVKAGSGTQEALSKYAVGGIVYSPKNIKSADQIKEMLVSTASMSKFPLFTILSDKALYNDQVIETLGLSLQEEITDEDTAHSAGATIGSTLFKYGFNMAMFPANDISENGKFGSDAESVKLRATAFATGLQQSGVSACGYAFPVMGSSDGDVNVSDKTRDDLVVGEFEVFKNAIDSKAMNAIRMSELSLPQLSGDDTPSTLSGTVIGEELKGTLGYEGIVITAPLGDIAISEKYSSAEAAVAAIMAGADMIYLPGDFTEAYEGILQNISEGRITEERINESIRKIMGIKYSDQVSQISTSN
ncbi:MAG: beta-N-acetylhexosaminidase [Butyrivibrio sp.]|nr:beta-N-acetylhexosaminidase [Butyrivibrio sp.]